MKHKQETLIAFYHNLEKLYYTIALCDKRIEEAEFKTLKNNIKCLITKLLFSDNEHINIDVNYQITTMFNTLYLESYSVQNCFDDFITFLETHSGLFTNKSKMYIMKTAGLIASSFSAKNK